MHEHLGSFKQSPSQKFCKNFFIFEKPQKVSQKNKKNLKLGKKEMKCMINEWIRVIPNDENALETEDHLGKRFGVREKCMGRWEVRKSRERSRQMKQKLRWPFI